MRAGQEKDFFIWRHFLHEPSGTVIVLPSPYREYKSGISYGNGWMHIDGWSERVLDYIAAIEGANAG